MYTVGLIISFKIALLISVLSVLSRLRTEANSFKKLGVTQSDIKRFYKENLASSSVTVGQVTLVVGSILSWLSLATLWAIS